MTKEQFIESATLMFGAERVEKQKHTIRPCKCGSEVCLGWIWDAGEETDPLMVFNPPIVRV